MTKAADARPHARDCRGGLPWRARRPHRRPAVRRELQRPHPGSRTQPLRHADLFNDIRASIVQLATQTSANANRQHTARSLMLLIQMASEAARFKDLEGVSRAAVGGLGRPVRLLLEPPRDGQHLHTEGAAHPRHRDHRERGPGPMVCTGPPHLQRKPELPQPVTRRTLTQPGGAPTPFRAVGHRRMPTTTTITAIRPMSLFAAELFIARHTAPDIRPLRLMPLAPPSHRWGSAPFSAPPPATRPPPGPDLVGRAEERPLSDLPLGDVRVGGKESRAAVAANVDGRADGSSGRGSARS
ncbi:ribosome-inactivating family protein [Streptomyces sp. ISL-94]|uniref:ribosome-inactivating family protein n=1 Tax=Streptomyces sp. ISL-94 TaxID=2819190 RepID=UPI001BE73EED|nr:hypothetical protein [Streptomyces sp. ISL-94]